MKRELKWAELKVKLKVNRARAANSRI
jgi:hypothetical protein